MTTYLLSKPGKSLSKEIVSVVISTFLTLPKKSVIRTFCGSRWKRSVRCPGVETHKLFGQTWNWKPRDNHILHHYKFHSWEKKLWLNKNIKGINILIIQFQKPFFILTIMSFEFRNISVKANHQLHQIKCTKVFLNIQYSNAAITFQKAELDVNSSYLPKGGK